MVERRLKVAFVDYVLEPDKPGRSGLSDIVWDMASELINQGHEAHVVASYHTNTYPDPRVTVHNFPTPPIGYRNVVGQLLILNRAAQYIKSIKPDIVHAPEYVSTAVMHTVGVRTPAVLTVPGNIYHRLSVKNGNSYEWHYAQVLKWAARVSARSCARVIAISQEMKRWWEWTGSPAEHTPLIPLGADPKRFFFVESARQSLGLTSDKLLLLYVGRFSREKGLLTLLTALAHIASNLTGLPKRLELVLIGKGPLRQEIDLFIHEHQLTELVTLHHWVNPDELRAWYSAADALILPSYTEGFSRTIPEAMSCGTPVIGTRIAGTEDHVIDYQNGYLFEAGDAENLAAILQHIIERPDYLQGMRETTYRYAQTHLQWPCIVNEIVHKVYLPAISMGTDE